MGISTRHPRVVWLALAIPLIAIKLGILLGIGFYSGRELAEDSMAAAAFCALTVLAVRWRTLGVATWLAAWLFYVLKLIITLAEALSFYFQGTTFSTRFFSNI